MNRIDKSSDFFVLNAFLICGTALETAKPVAKKLIIGSKKSTMRAISLSLLLFIVRN